MRQVRPVLPYGGHHFNVNEGRGLFQENGFRFTAVWKGPFQMAVISGKAKTDMTPTIRVQDLDQHFKEEVAREPGCQHLFRCFACGACTATCPVSEVEPTFSPSLIIRQVLYGMKSQLLTSPALWYCARCAQCSFQCPQDVRFADIVQGLRNLAVREGWVDPSRGAQLERAEKLIQELRRRLLAELLAAPGVGLDLEAALARLLADPDLFSEKEP